MGHEFVGSVEKVGSKVSNFKPGDKVVSPFTISCGSCFFCSRGRTSRCKQSRLFGSAALQGMQAEYVRIPLADSTLYQAPSSLPFSIFECGLMAGRGPLT
jgi:threonine dehydrogenase-like Zn-dependent dehydrogenase